MLPFLKKSRQQSPGIATVYKAPDDEAKAGMMRGVELAMEDLAGAMERKDHKGMARAIKTAFEILDASPHEEGEHTNEESPEPHSYDAQKE